MSSNSNSTNMDKIFLCNSVIHEGMKCGARGRRCKYAHTVEELRPRLCNRGDKCNKYRTGTGGDTECKFVHPDEDIEDYVERLCKHVGNQSDKERGINYSSSGAAVYDEAFPEM